MASQIDPSKPADGTAAVKAELRANLAAARSEIEALQDGKAALAHTHEVEETTVAGARTLGAAELGRLLTYTGGGDDWTLTDPARAGEVAIENDGSGPITLSASGITIAGGPGEIGAGKSASLRFFAGGAKVKVFVQA